MLKRKINKMNSYMIDKPRQLIMYNTVLSIAIFSAFIICLVESIMQYERKGLLVIVSLLIYLIALFVLGNIYEKMLPVFSAMIIAPVNFLFMPYMFLFAEGGGIRSGMPVWVTFGLLITFLMLSGRLFVVFFILTVLVDAFCFSYSYIFEHQIQVVEEASYYYTDNMIAVLTVSCSIGVVIKYFAKLQRMQKEKIDKAMLEIETEKQNAQAAKRTINCFIENVSYDIRTPMNAIIGMTQLAKENIQDTEKAKEYLLNVELSSKKLLHMVDNILDISELENGTLYLKSDAFDMLELLEEIKLHVALDAIQKKIDFEIMVGELHYTKLLGDYYRTKQALINVLNNAFSFTSPGGIVTFRIEQIHNELDSFAMFTFTVHTTAMVYSQDDMNEKLTLSMDEQIDTVSDVEKSSNLGMTVTKKILESMGARLKVICEKNKGTSFIMQARFPLQYEEIPGNIEEEIGVFDASGKNILVVDDSKIDMEIVESILQKIGANVLVAFDGETAITMVNDSEEDYIDLIIIDVQLPDIDGYEVARQIRCLPRDDVLSMPMITLTSNAASQDIMKSIENGMSAHVTKPLDVKELYHKVSRCLVTKK